MATVRNILWILTDQFRADCLGYMGHPVAQTPHLDTLARDGVVCENAFCQSPVCMASRGALMTGRYPEAAGIRGMGILPPSEVTVAEHLKRHGYRTGMFGKLHLTPEQYTTRVMGSTVPIIDWRRYADIAAIAPIADDPCKEQYGFDVHVGCDDLCQGLHQQWVAERAPAYLGRQPRQVAEAPGDLWVSPYPSEYHQTTFIAESCRDFLRGQDEQPWFACCSFIAPHHPFEAPADQIARYDLAAVPLPAWKGGVDPACIPPPMRHAVDEMHQYQEEIQRRIVLHYLASISLIDDNVGMLLATLRDCGQLDNTMVVFTADHGEFLGNHGLLRKPSLHYDEVIRVPLLLRLPDGPVRREAGLVELIDVLPTCLGWLDLPGHPGMQGRDWSAALRAGEPIGREDIYSDMFDLDPMVCATAGGPYGAACTLRTTEWKLTVYPTAGRDYGQLFDLRADLEESHNLYGDPAAREQRDALLWRLFQRRFTNADPLPLRLTQF